jgi:diguanylate cyclase (GGDEF)-like protein
LKDTAEIIRSNIRRPLDLVGRYRHDIYCALLYSAEIKPALVIAEKIRSEVETHKFEHKGFVVEIHSSVSIGIATIMNPSLEDSLENLIANASNNLQEAKRKGRNCVYFGESAL